MTHDFMLKLEQQNSQSNERERAMVAELKKTEEENATLKEKLTQSQAEIRDLQNEMTILSERLQKLTYVFTQHSRQQAGNPPHQLAICNFEQRKQNDLKWHGPPMYIAKGPKIGICVHPNGTIGTNARGSHVSVLLCAMIGECDDFINWPVRCTITVELRNQHNNENHYRMQRGFQWERPKGCKTVGNFGSDQNEHQFISHARLEFSAPRKTRYLQDDTLHLVVVRIEPHSEIYAHGFDRAERMPYSSLAPEKSLFSMSM
jgi:uncharacterized coiled-coil protein SlyX